MVFRLPAPVLALVPMTLLACGPDSGPTGSSSTSFGRTAIGVDGVTFVAGDGRALACEIERTGWVLPVGNLVPLEVDNTMNFAGYTRGDLPTIVLNLASLDNTPIPGQIFVFAHECGHVNTDDFYSETAANCWAAGRLSAQGLFSAEEWEVVHEVLLSAYPAPRDAYPSGADQWEQLQACR